MPRYPKLLAYAQLMRLPNVFTAFADICLGASVSGVLTDRPGVFAGLLAVSGGLYLAGMVWNDYFDRLDDAKTQPFRPIPSGRVPPGTAVLIAVVLTAVGLGTAWFIGGTAQPGSLLADYHHPLTIAVVLTAAILLYDGWLKRTPLGPVGMGFCRFLNVLLGLSAAALPGPDTGFAVHLAAVVGVYIVGVTWFARTEETDSDRRNLLFAAGVMALSLVLALTLPLHALPGETPWYFPFLIVGFGFHIGIPVTRGISRRDPKSVQIAVKTCILGLVALDAVLATAFVGLWGLLILLLLLPARFLGKWVYST